MFELLKVKVVHQPALYFTLYSCCDRRRMVSSTAHAE